MRGGDTRCGWGRRGVSTSLGNEPGREGEGKGEGEGVARGAKGNGRGRKEVRGRKGGGRGGKERADEGKAEGLLCSKNAGTGLKRRATRSGGNTSRAIYTVSPAH